MSRKVMIVGVLLMGLVIVGTLASADEGGFWIDTPWGRVWVPYGGSSNNGSSNDGQGSSGQTGGCEGIPFPLPKLPGLDCGDFPHASSNDMQLMAISASMIFWNGKTSVSLPFGTSNIPIYIQNLPINRPVTIWLGDVILPNYGKPQVLQYNLSGYYPSGQRMIKAYAGNRGTEYFFAWVDTNGDGLAEPGEVTSWLTMYVY